MPPSLITVDVGKPMSELRRVHRSDTSVGTPFEPRHAVRCVGEMRFRYQAARDLACLLDLDGDVTEWTCLPPPLDDDGRTYVIDFSVTRTSGTELVCVAALPENFSAPHWAIEAASEREATLRIVPVEDLVGDRLDNCRELLRYAKWRVSLSQRIGLLAALDHEGSLTLVECMSAVRNAADPIGVVAALALRRFVEIDLDSGPLGPETRVTRFRG
jgi:hypothetical protein